MQNFRKLRVWQRAHALTLAIYRSTKAFPAIERYGLSAQLRSAAISIAANIAEGCGHASDGSMRRHVQIATGSACEIEAELLVARELEYISAAAADDLIGQVVELRRMLITLLKAMTPSRGAR
ncbi:MAG TPA: four helix bundle protein [Gemmatimonadaceae bacterium]|nr:four helix bundle protein [Gemmatimonadaceae bacterium]